MNQQTHQWKRQLEYTNESPDLAGHKQLQQPLLSELLSDAN